MLPNPPCISGLVGCDDSYDGNSGTFGGSGNGGSGGSSGSSGGTDFSFSGGGTIDTSGFQNGIQNGLNSAGNGASALGGALGSAGNNLASGIGSLGSRTGAAASSIGAKAQRYADYVISAINRGKEAIKGFSVTHGPLPSGAEFDPSRSSPECSKVGDAVQCTTDLAPGQKKDFTVAYKAPNSFSCALAKALQKVKSAASSLTGSANTNVSTSVSCSMKTVSTATGATSSGSTATGGAGSGLQGGGTGTGNGTAGGSGSLAGSPLLGSVLGTNSLNNAQNGSKTGYSAYNGVRMPQTGAGDFFSTTGHDYTLTPTGKHASQGGFSAYTEAIFVIVVGIAVIRTVKIRIFG